MDYVQGVTQALAGAGYAVPGFDMLVSSDVPVGSGLSSSAALEVAVLRALRMATGIALDDAEVASAPNREAIERCTPSEACQLACDAVRFCAVNACENRGANGGNIYAACVGRCASDESWAVDVRETRDRQGCVAGLTRYAEVAPGDLPDGCPSP